ncbi:MAG: TolC family protein [Bacteroidetes bacterium]|nr:TolC family protein [Bacteroidota bacterium]
MSNKLFILLLAVFISCTARSQSQGLDLYISEGLKNSPLLKDYQNQLQSGTLDSALLNAGRKPQVNAIASAMAAPTYKGYGYDEAVTNTGNYEALLSASQNIFAKKSYTPQYEAIHIENQSISNSAKLSEHDLRKSITDQYLLTYSSLNSLNYIQSGYTLLKDEERLLQQFVQQGIYKQTDYLSFQIATQSVEIQISQLQIEYKNNLRQLNLLCGINDTAYHVLTAPDLQPVSPKEKSLSPFLMQLKIDSLRIINQKNLVNVKYRPQFNWFADAGILGATPSLLYKNAGLSFGLNFSMPLYDGKQKNLQYQKLSINESTRNNYQQFFKNQYNMHIVQINMQLAENDRLIAQIKKQLAASETLINASKQLLNKGDLSVTDFIITIKNYIDIKDQLNQSQLQKLQLINELNYWNW